MYKIFADDTLIYDSTFEDYRIGKGQISLEVNKSGSFVFSLYPDHFYYNQFVRMKTIITVYKSERIVFRGRILNDVTDYHNNKVLTCEGELGFLRDSIVRPFEFTGNIAEFFTRWIENHNSQVDEWKRFKIGKITVTDSNDRIYRYSEQYEKTLNSLNSRTVNSDLGGLFYITHGEDGTDPIPTINYLSDSEKVATQTIEFGVNLKNYTKTVNAEEIVTAIIPVSEISTDANGSSKKLLTIEAINNGKDYVYSEAGVALYGWIFKMVKYEDVSNTQTLVKNAYRDLEKSILQNVTVELNAIDMHLLNRSIESFNVCDYIQAISTPHNFNATLICSKQTLDLLKPDNDKIVLGYAQSAFTQTLNKNTVSHIQTQVTSQIEKVSSMIAQTDRDVTLRFEKIGLEGTQAGLTRVNEDGIEVEHSNIGGKTVINADGFRLYDKDGKVLGGLLNIDGNAVSAVQRLANPNRSSFYVEVAPEDQDEEVEALRFCYGDQTVGGFSAYAYPDGRVALFLNGIDVSGIYAVGHRVHMDLDEPMGEDGDIWLCPVDPMDVS